MWIFWLYTQDWIKYTGITILPRLLLSSGSSLQMCIASLASWTKQGLDVINQLIINHQTDIEFKSKVGQAWYEVADHLDREDVMLLLKIVLNNHVLSFQRQFYKQLHRAAMGSPCSPVLANIYAEYFEKRALGPELPISFTIDTWLRYVDDVLTIVKKGTHDSTKSSKFN